MTTQAPQQELLLNRLRNIANGVRMYGSPDKELLADRLAAIASELAAAPAPVAQDDIVETMIGVLSARRGFRY